MLHSLAMIADCSEGQQVQNRKQLSKVPVSTASAERSSSNLKLIKTYLRSTGSHLLYQFYQLKWNEQLMLIPSVGVDVEADELGLVVLGKDSDFHLPRKNGAGLQRSSNVYQFTTIILYCDTSFLTPVPADMYGVGLQPS
ncbi:unnamed protein product [Acanthoscelides obtectus]|uniref:Uncharacterized protein n=1 Tax=Acanthoscelides obtectus TaxID=200917 RepID=A0A9P0M1H3_ACAOB|nr:unnamed protein product [Acanthoscelides obtectus]CAK1621041.1 hypothetical protein AOBTE_LOCUS718 [Acanthoscelides obtectus]